MTVTTDALHEDLAAIYRRGVLTPAERITVQGLWARIERLETAAAAIVKREGRLDD